MENNYVTMAENRDLRSCIQGITSGCFLLKEEYTEIMDIIRKAVIRESYEEA
jgi:hypothetical protein